MVVSNTSPLNYLILIGQIELLPQLYGRVLIPRSVHEELNAPETPDLCGGSLAVAQTSDVKLRAALTRLPQIVLDLLAHPAFRRRVKSNREAHRHLWRNAAFYATCIFSYAARTQSNT